MPALRRALLALTPAVALTVAALGFRLAVSGKVRAADLFVAPQASPSRSHWQLRTYAEERGVREVIAVPELTVTARAGGREATWRGASDANGVAEVDLALGELPADAEVTVRVEATGEAAPLLEGAFPWHAPPWTGAEPDAARRAAREGSLAIDAAPLGGRLVPGAESTIVVRVRDAAGHPAAGARVEVEPEPGLRVLGPGDVHACADGLAEIRAVAEHHLLVARVRARDALGATGSWYGTLAVAPGGLLAEVPTSVHAGEPLRVAFAPGAADAAAYAVLATPRGRSTAATVAAQDAAHHGAPRVLELPVDPDLAEGLAWLYLARTAEGPETFANATWAAPVVVGPRPATRCAALAALTAARPAGAPLERALEGLAGRRAGDRARARRGLALSLAALLAGALLETLLLVQAARAGERGVERLAELAEAEGLETTRALDTERGGRALALVTLAVLGFLLLAALVVFRADG